MTVFCFHTVTKTHHETFVDFTLSSRDQQVCILSSLNISYPGCAITFPCTFDGYGNLMSIHYFSLTSQGTVCVSVAPGCYSTAVFRVNKNGMINSLPATNDVIIVGKIGKRSIKLLSECSTE